MKSELQEGINKKKLVKKSIVKTIFSIIFTLAAIFLLFIRSFFRALNDPSSNIFISFISNIIVGTITAGIISYLIYLIVYFIYTKVMKKVIINKYFVYSIILLIYLLASTLVQIGQNMNEYKKEENTVQYIFKMLDSFEMGKKTQFEGFNKKQSGENSILIEYTEQMLKEVNECTIKADENVSKINIDVTIHPEHLSSLETIKNERENINNVIKSIDEGEKNFINIYEEYSKSINNAALKNKFMKSNIRILNKGIDKFLEKVKKYYVLLKRICLDIERIIEIFEENYGEFIYENGILNFSDDEKITKYNELVNNLVKSIYDVEQFEKNNQLDLENSIDKSDELEDSIILDLIF